MPPRESLRDAGVIGDDEEKPLYGQWEDGQREAGIPFVYCWDCGDWWMVKLEPVEVEVA